MLQVWKGDNTRDTFRQWSRDLRTTITKQQQQLNRSRVLYTCARAVIDIWPQVELVGEAIAVVPLAAATVAAMHLQYITDIRRFNINLHNLCTRFAPVPSVSGIIIIKWCCCCCRVRQGCPDLVW
jgi:hypothetical protein